MWHLPCRRTTGAAGISPPPSPSSETILCTFCGELGAPPHGARGGGGLLCAVLHQHRARAHSTRDLLCREGGCFIASLLVAPHPHPSLHMLATSLAPATSLPHPSHPTTPPTRAHAPTKQRLLTPAGTGFATGCWPGWSCRCTRCAAGAGPRWRPASPPRRPTWAVRARSGRPTPWPPNGCS